MTSNQSWTSWILDSYASSVQATSESPEDERSDPIEDEPTPKPATGSRSPSASSGFGPFVKTGRGGAGNFTWQSEQPVPDVETQRQSSLTDRQRAAAQIEHLDTEDALKISKIRKKKSLQYLRVGVGGAGNLMQSNEIQSPRSPSFTRSTSSPLSATFPKLHHGRGGAGNYSAAAEGDKKAESEKEYEARMMAERMREKAEQDVESILQPPQGALLSEGRRREGFV